jgi:hypothetical protein
MEPKEEINPILAFPLEDKRGRDKAHSQQSGIKVGNAKRLNGTQRRD